MPKPVLKFAQFFMAYLFPALLLAGVIAMVFDSDPVARTGGRVILGLCALVIVVLLARKYFIPLKRSTRWWFSATCRTCGYDLRKTKVIENQVGVPTKSACCPECGRPQPIISHTSTPTEN